MKAVLSISGRITVVIEPKESKIVACALWLPPKRRLSVWMVGTLIRAGMLPVLKRWGLKCLLVSYSEIVLTSIYRKRSIAHRCGLSRKCGENVEEMLPNEEQEWTCRRLLVSATSFYGPRVSEPR